MDVCDICHDTGFELVDNTARHCSCPKGRRIRAAHAENPKLKKGKAGKKEWLPYSDREPGDDPPF